MEKNQLSGTSEGEIKQKELGFLTLRLAGALRCNLKSNYSKTFVVSSRICKNGCHAVNHPQLLLDWDHAGGDKSFNIYLPTMVLFFISYAEIKGVCAHHSLALVRVYFLLVARKLCVRRCGWGRTDYTFHSIAALGPLIRRKWDRTVSELWKALWGDG